MSINVLLVRPPGNKIIEILVEGIQYHDSTFNFTVLEGINIQNKNERLEISYIDKKNFIEEKVSVKRKLVFLLKELFNFTLDIKKARWNASLNERKDRVCKYYSNIFHKFDLINIHYLEGDTISLLEFVPQNKKIMISLWGSDVYRSPEKKKSNQLLSLDKADVITLHSDEMKSFFINKFGEKYLNKIKKVLFGISESTINLIKEIKDKSYYDLPQLNEIKSDKIVIRIGYNADPGQQHNDVLDTLAKLDSKFKDKLHLILQLTYGGNLNYINDVTEKIKQTGIEYTLFTNYLSDIQVLEVTKRTDIYLNLRTTDSLNNAMIESFLFDKFVICGSWLPYNILHEINIKFITVNAISEIISTIEDFMKNREVFSKSDIKNSQKIEKLVSNKNTGYNWLEIYRSLLVK
jgi:hypothetical protein